MKYDLTILIPAIRQTRWEALYASAIEACKNHTWQLLLIGPFDLPDSLKDKPNIKTVKDFGQVSRCVQRGVPEADSDYIFLTVDDCTFVPGSIDVALEEYHAKCGFHDVLNVRYSENGDIQPVDYYRAGYHASTRLGGIHPDWYVIPQFIMAKTKYIGMGGFDCQFEYINEAVQDLGFRIQKMGGVVYQSSNYACVATWYPNVTGDHAPIHHAQTSHDYPIFRILYNKPNDRRIIDYDNWKDTPEVWGRRFSKGVPASYQELVEQENYSV